MRFVVPALLGSVLLSGCPTPSTSECSDAAKLTAYWDEDRDGHGDPTTATLRCTVGVGQWVSTGLDCDDQRPNVNPDSVEECDGLDNDCDQQVDEGLRELTYFADTDADGFGTYDITTNACSPPPGFVENASDCNDNDPLSFPGATEFCDGMDNDCDGLIDDDDDTIDPDTQTPWHQDFDGDGYGDPDIFQLSCEPVNGSVDNDDDCNDGTVAISPDAIEVCDGIDNDCDGYIDDSDDSLDPSGLSTWFHDDDGDGYGDPNDWVEACNQPWFYVGDATDCDDEEPLIQDAPTGLWVQDLDGDGYGTGAPSKPACDPPDLTGWVLAAKGDDCDDANPAVYPGANEVCDTIDNDCDTLIDDLDTSLDPASTTTWYGDVDQDGYGDVLVTTDACVNPPSYVLDATDCDDLDGNINPGAPEICNGGQDDNCDGLADANDPNLDPGSLLTWYLDFDQDGWGDASIPLDACTQPNGYVDNDLDCDDNDPYVLGLVDWVTDADGDGFGAGAVVANDCVAPGPNTAPAIFGLDCDDADPLSFPGADEVCGDTVDQSCDGSDQVCPPDTCIQANNRAPYTSDERWVHDLSTYANDINFTAGNFCTGGDTSSNDAIIPVAVQPGEAFTAWMSSATGDASLSLLNTCNNPDPIADCQIGGDAVGVGSVENVWYENTTAGVVNLFLVADCEGGCTDYTLELHFQAEIFSQTCADATTTPLTTGGHSLSGNLENGTNESDMGNLWCTGNDANGGEVWVPVDLAPGERVDLLDYTQLLDDSSAYVVSNCADPTGTCLIGADDNGAAQSESLSYANAGGVTERVFLVLDCFGVIGNCREYQAHIAVQ